MGLFDKLNSQLNANKVADTQMTKDEQQKFEMNFIFNGLPTMPIELQEKEGKKTNGIYYSNRFTHHINNPWDPTTSDGKSYSRTDDRERTATAIKSEEDLQDEYYDDIEDVYEQIIDLYSEYSEKYDSAPTANKPDVENAYKAKVASYIKKFNEINNESKYKNAGSRLKRVKLYSAMDPASLDLDLELADYYEEKFEEIFG